jgi:CysZ protein
VANPVGEFAAGVGLLWRGLVLLARRPRAFALGALPPALTSLLFLAIVVGLFAEVEPIAGWLTPFARDWSPATAELARAVVGIALIGAVILIMVVTFTALTLALGSPLYDKISESIEREYGDLPERTEPWPTGLLRGLRHSIVLIAESLAVAAVLCLTGFLPVVGQTVVPVLAAVLGGWMLCLELIGPAFERHGRLSLRDRRVAMRRHRARVIGFGVPTFLLLAIPFLPVVAFPVVTAAGTLLARHLLGAPSAAPVGRPQRGPLRSGPR